MLKPRTLMNVLSMANTGGIECTLLFNREGTLLAYSGYEDKDARMTAAISSNMWLTYENMGKIAFNEDSIQSFIMEGELGNIIVRRVSNVLLCMHAKKSVSIGTLKNKIEAVVKFLEVPLDCVASAT